MAIERELYQVKPLAVDTAEVYLSSASALLSCLGAEAYEQNVIGALLSGVTGNDKSLDLEALAKLMTACQPKRLEKLAQLASARSLRHFGRGITLYTPVYLSNACINGCLYCGYSAENEICRRTLSLEEAKVEADCVLEEGLKHVLLLSGESEQEMPFETFLSHCQTFIPKFSSVSVETYGLDQASYKKLANAGVYGVTLYQETYLPSRYAYLHPYGPKSDFMFRFEAPERVAKAGLHHMNMGILLGLSDWRIDLLLLIDHGKALQKAYPQLELSFSLPRIIAGEGQTLETLGIVSVSDFDFVLATCLLRLAFPRAAINCSTRESAHMRRHLIPIGVNKMSAGVDTSVGGRMARKMSRSELPGHAQFAINDHSSVTDVSKMLASLGYHPVMSDWSSDLALHR